MDKPWTIEEIQLRDHIRKMTVHPDGKTAMATKNEIEMEKYVKYLEWQIESLLQERAKETEKSKVKK